MSNLKQIEITILKRDFPVTVPAEEAPRVQKAAAIIEQKIAEYKQRYAVGEDMYLVLMCCLDLATENLALQEEGSAVDALLPEKLRAIRALLEAQPEETIEA
jgi:cell division protein ZapA